MAAGPVVGGFLIDSLGWRSIFLVNLPIGLIGIWVTCRFVDEAPGLGDRRLDLAGQLLVIVALLGSIGAVIEAGSLGWTNPTVVSGLAMAVVSGIGFLIVEACGAAPMLPLRFFRNRTFAAATLVGLLVNMSFYGVFFLLGLYFQRVRLYSSVETGFAFIPLMATVVLSNVAAGRIVARVGSRLPMAAGFVIGAVGFGLLRDIDGETSYAILIPGFILLSGGLGLAIPAMTTALLSTVDRSRAGVASGVLNTVRQAGGALGVAVFGALVAGGAGRMVPGIRASLLVACGLSLFAACISVVGISPHRQP